METNLLALTALVAIAISASGCSTEQMAAAGAPSMAMAADIPVGPVPGPGERRNPIRNPYGEDRVAINAGRQLFVQYNCAGCHGGHAGGGMGPSLRDEAWIYGNSDEQIFASVAQGRAHGMPAWGSKVPELQTWKLVAYIKSLRTPNEADPPE